MTLLSTTGNSLIANHLINVALSYKRDHIVSEHSFGKSEINEAVGQNYIDFSPTQLWPTTFTRAIPKKISHIFNFSPPLTLGRRFL